MANSITYATLFQKVLDDQMVQESVTGWMTPQGVIYNGGKTVKIPKMSTTGLGNYSRANGYARGSVMLEYETFTMTQDRGAQFLLDKADVDESNFVVTAMQAMSDFQRHQVIPEIDAYRLSAIAAKAVTADAKVDYGYTPANATIKSKLIKALNNTPENAVIYMTPDALGALEEAVDANISSVTFNQAGFDLRVPAFNGRPIIRTDASRMVTKIETKDLDLDNEETGGWAKAATGKDINFMVVARTVPKAIDKLDEPKIFEPATVQNYSGWLIDYRRYHDLWVTDNQIANIYVNIKDAK